MALSKEQIEYLHDTGKMPDWVYYQYNGATAEENYRRQKQEIHRKRLYELQQRELENTIENKLETILERLFNELDLQ